MKGDEYSEAEILIAEDNATNYFLLKELVHQFGVKHIWAKNGLEVLDILETHKDISVILMDISMPQMDGITATRKIRGKRIDIPVIFQTAYASEENIEECFKAGGNDFISKPLNKEKISLVLRKYLFKNQIH
ncbi:MAG TPA: response regulator [Bacteroidales bacterium]